MESSHIFSKLEIACFVRPPCFSHLKAQVPNTEGLIMVDNAGTGATEGTTAEAGLNLRIPTTEYVGSGRAKWLH